VASRASGAVTTGLTFSRPTTAKADPANANGHERCGTCRTPGLVAVLARLMDPRTEENELLCRRLGASRVRHELPEFKLRWRRLLFAALEAAATPGLCGLTFELTPTAEAGGVSLD
jgi:hypothetical protein